MEYIKSEHYDHVRNDYGRELVIPSEREWAEVKRGRWIRDGVAKGSEMCDQCGFVQLRHRANNYCPYCGARMEQEE